MPTQPAKVSADELRDALRSRDFSSQFWAFEQYSKQKPTVDAIPTLRKALRHKKPFIVRCAAEALGKLRADGVPAMPDLLDAAYKTDRFGMPQAYIQCLTALVAIEPTNDRILPLITHWVGVDDWWTISTSMRALNIIGTSESHSLLVRVHAFWYSHFKRKFERTIADRLLAESLQYD